MRIIDDVLLQANPLLEMFRGKFFSEIADDLVLQFVFLFFFFFFTKFCVEKQLLNSSEICQRELQAGIILLEIFRNEFHLAIADLAA